LFTREEGASAHCQMGRLSYAHSVIFGWLNHVLCGKPLAPHTDPGASEKFIDTFRRYGGANGAERAKSVFEAAHLL